MSKSRGAFGLLVVMALAIPSAGCDDDEPTTTDGTEAADGPIESSTTDPTTTTEPVTVTTSVWQRGREREREWTPEEQAIVDVVHAYYDAYFEAIEEPVNPDHEGMAATLTDTMRITITDNLTGLIERGEAGRPAAEPVYERYIVEIRLHPDGHAQVLMCTVDDGVIYNIDTLAVVDDSISTKTTEIIALPTPDGWRLDRIIQQERTEGVTTCGT